MDLFEALEMKDIILVFLLIHSSIKSYSKRF